MVKYKICPSCGTKNDPMLIECRECEADLSRVKITDEENERLSDQKETADIAHKNVRICDCGEENPPNARKCRACGEDISDVTPSARAEEKEETERKEFFLSSVDGKYAYKITGETVVGRENAMCEYLRKKSYVSRTHASFSIEEGVLKVENLSKTNFTFVNNKRITEKTSLSAGDEIGLGGISKNGRQDMAAYFVVKEVKCT